MKLPNCHGNLPYVSVSRWRGRIWTKRKWNYSLISLVTIWLHILIWSNWNNWKNKGKNIAAQKRPVLLKERMHYFTNYSDYFTVNGVLASLLNLLYRFAILSPRTSVLGTDNFLKERGLETIQWRDPWSAGLFLCTCSIRFVDLASILKLSNGFKLASLEVWRSFIYYASW